MISLVIFGSRTAFPTFDEIDSAIADLDMQILKAATKRRRLEILCGMARGADACGMAWAVHYGVKVRKFPALWKEHGRAAGPIRNEEMAEAATHGLGFWDGASIGTKHMIKCLEKLSKPCHVVRWPHDDLRHN